MQKVQNYIQENRERFLNELMELLKIPSISADAAYAEYTHKTADVVAESLKKAGADNVEICQTAGYPIVYADKIIDKNAPTILVYGHYDVQPPDPMDLWKTPPFEPTIRKTKAHPEGAIYARGSCDDKGQAFMHVKAFELMIQTNKYKNIFSYLFKFNLLLTLFSFQLTCFFN